MGNKPLIMIANDDGYRAKGFYKLIELMRNIGEVVAISTEKPMSGQSHSITTQEPLRVYQADSDVDYKLYVCNGRPVDCVKIGYRFTDGRMPDLMVSGINHGSNAGVNVIYSGTMGACFVGAEHGIPSIGYSIDDHNPDADFSYFESYILELTRHLLEEGMPYGVCYNINAPVGELQGVRWTRQCRGFWQKEMEERVDENGEKYYWLTGEFVNIEPEVENTDIWAMNNHYVSVHPCTIDQTAYAEI